MTKKFIYALVLVLALAACSDKDKVLAPAPEISGVVIEGSSEENPLTIEVGGTITFTIKVKEQADVTYSWILDEKEVGTENKFSFVPEKAGEYKLSVIATNGDGVATGKEVGTIKVAHSIPVITKFMCGENLVPGDIEVTASSKLSFKVEAEKAENVTYYWILNEDTLKDENKATLDFELGLSGTLKVALVNNDKVSVDKEVTLVGPYKNGTYIFGTTEVGLCFIDEKGVQHDDNIYGKVNGGESLGSGGINDFQIYKNKAYILVPDSPEKKARVVIADAQTMKKLDIITATGFTSANLGTIYNLTIVDKDKAYIGSNSISAGNTSSVKVLDMKEKTMAEVAIEGTSGKFGEKGPAWARMLTLGKHTLVACGPKIQVISHATDKVEKTIEFDAKQVVDIVKGRDNKIYALVNGETSFIATINPETFAEELESRVSLTYNSKKLSFTGGGMSSAHASASPVSDDIFFSVGEDTWGTGWFQVSPEIYKYNYTSRKVELFTDVKKSSGASAINGYMGVDGKGRLIVPLSGEYSYRNEAIITYDVKTGKLESTSYKRVLGEGNAFPTWMSR